MLLIVKSLPLMDWYGSKEAVEKGVKDVLVHLINVLRKYDSGLPKKLNWTTRVHVILLQGSRRIHDGRNLDNSSRLSVWALQRITEQNNLIFDGLIHKTCTKSQVPLVQSTLTECQLRIRKDKEDGIDTASRLAQD